MSRREPDLLAKHCWQAAIRSLIRRASHVFIAVGISGGVKWELQQLENEVDSRKVSLLILPEEGSILTTWRLFAAQYPRLLDCPDSCVERALVVRFDQDGFPVFFCARKKSIQGYRLALSACFVPLEKIPGIHSLARRASTI